jgi:hypothetical protein
MSTACIMNFSVAGNDEETFQIKIEPETGYAYVVGQEDL